MRIDNVGNALGLCLPYGGVRANLCLPRRFAYLHRDVDHRILQPAQHVDVIGADSAISVNPVSA